MKHQIIVTHQAIGEVDDIYSFIADDSVAHASAWYDRLMELIGSLREFPERCPLALENKRSSYTLRHLIYGNYRVIFTVRDKHVIVLHVRHAARRPMSPEDI